MKNSVRHSVAEVCNSISACYYRGSVFVELEESPRPIRLGLREGLGFVAERVLIDLLGARYFKLSDKHQEYLMKFGGELSKANMRSVKNLHLDFYDAVQIIVRTLVQQYIFLRLVEKCDYANACEYMGIENPLK